MSLDQSKQLKFQDGNTTEPLEIQSAGMEEFPFGSKFVVHIKPLISGEDHFIPSPGLQNKIKEENIDKGDKITITKVPKSDKYPYGYFSVSVIDKGKGPNLNGAVSDSPVGAGFAQKDAKHEKLEKHELSLRVESLEAQVKTLTKWYESQNTTKEKANDLPF